VARIAVDAMGGDRAPVEIVAGAREAAADGIEITLFGPAGLDTQGLPLVEAPDVIEMHEKPGEAVRAKPQSSLVAAHTAVAEGRADAVVSAGNTGAMLAAGLLRLRRIPGVLRPAIAVPIPTRRGPSVLLDSGANADARPEHLLQFGHMGAIFAEEILGIGSPEVRLLSIGEEAEKGNQLTLEAHALLAASELRFAGNAESRDLLAGAADVVVCDGFTGNVALKLLEGTIRTVLDSLREEIVATPRGKLGGLLIRPAAGRLRARLDPDTYGGAYLLGLRGLSVIAHGNSGRRAISNAIHLAARGVEHDVVGRLQSRIPRRSAAATV
jgi:glycerol-3-phosphate acyltransferase PlsX